MTRDDLIKNIQVKMDVDLAAGADDYYANYYNSLIDECLSVIANTVLPYQGVMNIIWGGYYDDGDNIKSDVTYYTADSEQEDSNNDPVKRKDWLEVIIDKNGEPKLKVQHRNNYGFLAKLPNDFLSFSDEANIEYRDGNNELSLNADILYVNSKTIALSKDGSYTIYYNSEYPSIATLTDNDIQLETIIPTNVLKIIPSYVAGQLLMGEDPIKATQLKNEFETMMARLDINKPLVSYSINNSDGWVL